MANLRELNSNDPFWGWVSEIERQNRANGNMSNDNNNGEGPSQRTTPLGDQEPLLSEKEKEKQDHDMSSPPPEFHGPPPPNFADPPSPPPPDYHGPPPPPHHHTHHHHHGFGRGGHHRGGPGFGHRGGHDQPRGGPWQRGSWGAWAENPPQFGIGWGPKSFGFGGRRGGCRGRNQWENTFAGRNGAFDLSKLTHWLNENLGLDINDIIGQPQPQAREQRDKDFSPAIDVFDTPGSYHIHLSLPGAKKSDVDVSWDQENYQIIVSGIVHRPGDEDFLKTLAVDEREIGVFKREIKLGTKSQPVSVDADGIAAKMEDGVLMVMIPKQEDGFVEVKRVDIE